MGRPLTRQELVPHREQRSGPGISAFHSPMIGASVNDADPAQAAGRRFRRAPLSREAPASSRAASTFNERDFERNRQGRAASANVAARASE